MSIGRLSGFFTRVKQLAELNLPCCDAVLYVKDGIIEEMNGDAAVLFGDHIRGQTLESLFKVPPQPIFDAEITLPTGLTRLFRISLDQVQNGWVAAMRDITPQMQNGNYHAIFHESLDAILILDGRNGGIVEANQSAIRVFGYPLEELRGKRMESLFPEESLPTEGVNAFDGVFEAHTFLTANDEIRYMDVTAKVIPWDDGLAIYATLRDVTELEAVKANQRDIQTRLRHYAEELESSNRELQSFAYMASHDLREPLRMVANYCNLLQKRYATMLDEDANEFLAYALGGAERMQDMLDGLLDYSRVQTHGHTFRMADCHELANDAVSNLRVVIEESHATITIKPLPTLLVDTTQILQLFQNLIGNALKFRGKNNPEILVWAEHAEDHWLFAVRDNGIGIAPKDQERIFAIFKRLHTQEAYSGSGIGLAICKRIVERHGGRLWVESAPGEGATFYFQLAHAASGSV